jgi:hypothetical protein
VIIGHGLRDRQVRGPLGVGEVAGIRAVRVRRYLCCRCKAVLVVLPRGVIARRHFGAAAIAWAFALVGLLGEPQSAAWAAVSAWGEPRGCWTTLRRWAAAVIDRRLLPAVRGVPVTASVRQVAERAALVVRSLSPVRGALADEVFAGAAYAAHAG